MLSSNYKTAFCLFLLVSAFIKGADFNYTFSNKYTVNGIPFMVGNNSVQNVSINGGVVTYPGVAMPSGVFITPGNNSITVSSGVVTTYHGVTMSSSSGISIMSGNNSITVFNGNSNNPQRVALTGIEEKIEQPLIIDAVSIPREIARIIVLESTQPTYYTCDQVFRDVAPTVENGTLTLKAPHNSFTFENIQNKPLYTIYTHLRNHSIDVRESSEVIVNAHDLQSVSMSGASSLTSDNTVIMDQLQTLNMSGATQITIPHLQVPAISSIVSGASEVTLQGSASKQKLNLSGTAQYHAVNLESNMADANVSGCAKAELYVKQKLSGRVSGMASITYRGNATNNVHKSGMASCSKHN